MRKGTYGKDSGTREYRDGLRCGPAHFGKPVRAWLNLLLVALVASLGLICPVMSSAQSEVEEYRLKAAFLFHFAQFVEWPPEVFTDKSFSLCILGEGPFHGDLEDIVQGKSLGTKVIRIRHIKKVQDNPGCQLLFIGKGESKSVYPLPASLRSTPILTVGETDDFLQQGGIIRFCLEDRKIRFEVNQDAALDARLKISSRLLLLAKTVVESGNRK